MLGVLVETLIQRSTLQPFPEQEQVPSDHGIHNDDQYQRDNKGGYCINAIHHVHEAVIYGKHFALFVSVLIDDSGGFKYVELGYQRHCRDDDDDRLGSGIGAKRKFEIAEYLLGK